MMKNPHFNVADVGMSKTVFLKGKDTDWFEFCVATQCLHTDQYLFYFPAHIW